MVLLMVVVDKENVLEQVHLVMVMDDDEVLMV
jgi:hypothetical protein